MLNEILIAAAGTAALSAIALVIHGFDLGEVLEFFRPPSEGGFLSPPSEGGPLGEGEDAVRPLSSGSRAGLVLVFIGVIGGIPSALGLGPLGSFGALGGMVACMAGRRLAADAPAGPVPQSVDVRWFLVVSWCALTGLTRLETLDPARAMAAQEILGPASLLNPLLSGFVVGLAWLTGIAASAIWVRSASLARGWTPGPIQALVVPGETALAAAIVSGWTFGPTFAALSHGSIDQGSVHATALGTGALVVAVAAISLLSRSLGQGTLSRAPSRILSVAWWAAAPLSVLTMLVAAWAL